VHNLERILLDVTLVVSATLLAHWLLTDFSPSWQRTWAITPYVLTSGIATSLIVPAFRLERRLWQYASMADYARICCVALTIVTVSLAITYSLDQLDGVARALPVLQLLLTLGGLIGARGIACWWGQTGRRPRARHVQFGALHDTCAQTVLLIGTTELADIYLRALDVMGTKSVQVAGIIGLDDQHVGRLFRNLEVLGGAADIGCVLRRLRCHGIVVDRFVVTEPLPSDILADLAQTAAVEGITLHDASGRVLLGADLPIAYALQQAEPVSRPVAQFNLSPEQTSRQARRLFWSAKRAIDFIAALGLIIVMLPVFALTALVVVIDVGFPVLFWQSRPGLGGRAFKVVKFRTMRPQYTLEGVALSDQARTSNLGAFIRRLRLDELPQLFAILSGQMSFIGPRPLLAGDQPPAARARLLVRPGLTGLAQVAGGRLISPIDKAALDLSYIHNASLWCDIKILLRTVALIVRGERRQYRLIANAWQELHRAGIVKDERSDRVAHSG